MTSSQRNQAIGGREAGKAHQEMRPIPSTPKWFILACVDDSQLLYSQGHNSEFSECQLYAKVRVRLCEGDGQICLHSFYIYYRLRKEKSPDGLVGKKLLPPCQKTRVLFPDFTEWKKNSCKVTSDLHTCSMAQAHPPTFIFMCM